VGRIVGPTIPPEQAMCHVNPGSCLKGKNGCVVWKLYASTAGRLRMRLLRTPRQPMGECGCPNRSFRELRRLVSQMWWCLQWPTATNRHRDPTQRGRNRSGTAIGTRTRAVEAKSRTAPGRPVPWVRHAGEEGRPCRGPSRGSRTSRR